MSDDEQEANYFAMHLLVPTNLLRAEVRKLGRSGVDLSGDDDLMKKLGKVFGVSANVIAFRLAEESEMLK
jgi:Zn-dependent peptidase ImmA (M78 family)